MYGYGIRRTSEAQWYVPLASESLAARSGETGFLHRHFGPGLGLPHHDAGRVRFHSGPAMGRVV
jgi:hypothetical protein